MLHLTKLAVGVRDADHLRELQAERLRDRGRLFHRTRNFPRRRSEVLDGGSMYWVIAGTTLVRQRIVDIVEDQRDDLTPCTSFILDPELVLLVGRPTRRSRAGVTSIRTVRLLICQHLARSWAWTGCRHRCDRNCGHSACCRWSRTAI